jgi:hypothetical protein
MPVSNEKMDGNPLGTLTVTRRLLNTSRRGPQNDRPVPKSCNISPSLSWRFGKFSTKINESLVPHQNQQLFVEFWVFPCWNLEQPHLTRMDRCTGLSKLSPRLGEACRSAGEALSVLGGMERKSTPLRLVFGGGFTFWGKGLFEGELWQNLCFVIPN